MLTGRVLILIGLAISAQAFTKYGRSCKDIGCLPSQVCAMVQDSCSYTQRDGKDCGSYPTCMKNTNGGNTGSDVSASHSNGQSSHDFDMPTRNPSQGGSHSSGSNFYPTLTPQRPPSPAYPSNPMNPSYPSNPSSYPSNPSYPNPAYPANPSYPSNPSYPGNNPSGGYRPSSGGSSSSGSKDSSFSDILSGFTKILGGGGSSGSSSNYGGSGISSLLNTFGGGGSGGSSGGGLSSILSSFGNSNRGGASSNPYGSSGGSSGGGLSSILSSFGSDNRGGSSGSSGTSLLSGLSSLFSGGGGSSGGIQRTRYGGLFNENTPSDSSNQHSTTKVGGYPTQPPNHQSYPIQQQQRTSSSISSPSAMDRSNQPESRTVQYGWNVHK